MRWVAKASIQRVLSAVPRGDLVNYQLQRRVTKALPRSDAHFRLHARETVRHFEALGCHAPDLDPAAARFYEFGAGWDLITPLIFWGLGVQHDLLVDIRANIRLGEVDHSIAQSREHAAWLEELAGRPLRLPAATPVGSVGDLERRFGITYTAPVDARATGLEPGSVDFVSSTYTLEHIPAADIAAIMVECGRLLRPGGVVSCAIDMEDHYSHTDPSVSPYNFMKFSDRTWALVNSSLHYQNRLRRPDYRRIFDGVGLEIVAEEWDEPTAEDLALVRGLKLAPRFRAYSEADLAIKVVRLVARKPRPGQPRRAAGPRLAGQA